MRVNDVMTQGVISISPSDSVCDVAQLMKEHDVGAVPVVSEGKVQGIITDRDIVMRCMAENKNYCEMTAEQIMSKHVTAVNSTDSIGDALEKMSDFQVQRLPVVDNGQLKGMLSLSDIARLRVYEEVSDAVAEIKMPSAH